MDPVKLASPDGKMYVYACSKCQRASQYEDLARTCCAPKTCTECGVETKEIWYPATCAACHNRKSLAQEAARMAKATRVHISDYTGSFVVYNDDYVTTDSWYDDPDAPDEVWGVEPHPTPTLDAESILENALSEHWDDALSYIDVQGLQDALDAWHSENLDCRGVIEDNNTVVWREPYGAEEE